MEKYDLSYEILDYGKLQTRLNSIVNNPNNKFRVTKHEPIGKSSCGFDIDHYSIGSGDVHILYFAGCHGNEIISVDFVTQLMRNLAQGNGTFADFDPSRYTIDFIPCQNPEGFYTTTYAINSVVGNMDATSLEQFCKKYWQAYRNDDVLVTKLNGIIKSYCESMGIADAYNKISQLFWRKYAISDSLTANELLTFLSSIKKGEQSDEVLKESENTVCSMWLEKFPTEDKSLKTISMRKQHQDMFASVTLDSIPEFDENHKKLKENLAKIYDQGEFPLSTMANFFANSHGVNLNDNNPFFFQEFKENMTANGTLYASLRENNLKKSIPGPIGMPNHDMTQEFAFENENQALFTFLEKQAKKGINFASINCHGTGGLFFTYPVYDYDREKVMQEGETRNFAFTLNNMLATEYTWATGEYYKRHLTDDQADKAKPAKEISYRMMGHPDRITGVGDMLRKNYHAAFLLELSKMGGNPLAPYGDRKNNYHLTMEANFEACIRLLDAIKRTDYLYHAGYTITYDEFGQVHYEVTRDDNNNISYTFNRDSKIIESSKKR